MAKTKFAFDPFQIVLDVFHDFYPDAEPATIWYVGKVTDWNNKEMKKVWGLTSFPDDLTKPITIDIKVDMPVHAAVEILAHELAHLAAGRKYSCRATGTKEGDRLSHGPKWERIFARMQKEYEKRVQARYEVLHEDFEWIKLEAA